MTSAVQLVRDLFGAIDAGDLEKLGTLITDGVHFRFGSAEPLAGKAALLAAGPVFA